MAEEKTKELDEAALGSPKNTGISKYVPARRLMLPIFCNYHQYF
jgi:hypothetical protein